MGQEAAESTEEFGELQWLIFGLGNPGPRYRGHRHNLGVMLVERLQRRWGWVLRAGPGDYLHASGGVRNRRIHLIQPLTYMNLSGRAVGQVLELERTRETRMLIVVDDVSLDLGKIRLRTRGSAGGHNGLRSVESELQTQEYARLRLGCGPPPEGMDLAEFVLADFAPAECSAVGEMLERAEAAVWCWITEGPETAMSRFNG